MGAQWIIQVSEFFSPDKLEDASHSYASRDDGLDGPWFEDPNTVSCAVLSLAVLASALDVASPRHQVALAQSSVPTMVVHWLLRQGPSPLAQLALVFLRRLIDGNAAVISQLAASNIQYSGFKTGYNIAASISIPAYQLSTRLHGQTDKRCIAFSSLLAELYVGSLEPWSSDAARDCSKLPLLSVDFSFPRAYLDLFELVLQSDPNFAGKCIQHILAPVMDVDLLDDDDDSFALEASPSLGSFILNSVFVVCQQLKESNSIGPSLSLGAFQRAAHVLLLLFLHGGLLAKELATALSSSHCMTAEAARQSAPQPILTLLLSSVGRAVKLPAVSVGVAIPLLQLLSVATHDCERAAYQVSSRVSVFIDNPLTTYFVYMFRFSTTPRTSSSSTWPRPGATVQGWRPPCRCLLAFSWAPAYSPSRAMAPAAPSPRRPSST